MWYRTSANAESLLLSQAWGLRLDRGRGGTLHNHCPMIWGGRSGGHRKGDLGANGLRFGLVTMLGNT